MVERLLKTSEVAQRLGLSGSSVKRLVDSGHLSASRTLGKHRLISESEVERYRRKLAEETRGLSGDEGGSILPMRPSVDSLVAALRRGDEELARSLLIRANESGLGAAELGDDLIRPVMGRIGLAWEVGELDIFQEHRASRILESALMTLIRRKPAPTPDLPLAMGASPSGDLYTLSGLLCELTLRELGWEVANLGANLPLDSLAKAVEIHRPRLVWLSVSHLTNPDRFVDAYRRFFEMASRHGAAIVLGGSALQPDLRARLVAASFGDRLMHLREFARNLAPASPATPPRISDHPGYRNP